MKVLVTGAGALLGQGIIRCLRMAATPQHVIGVDPDPCAVGLFWSDKRYLVPLANDSAYGDRITQLIDLERPDAVLVGTDVELPVLAELKPKLEAAFGTHVIVSPPEVVAIADDKWRTYEFLSEHGFPRPLSTLPAGLPVFLRQCDFPLVVKPRSGARSVGVRTVHDQGELEAALREMRDPMVQQQVGDEQREFTSGLLVTEGKCRAVVTMRRELRDGNTYRAFVEPDSPCNALLAEVAEALGATGPVNFQFRLDGDTPKIFEINARFSGTTPLRALAGFNEVEAVLQHFVQGQPIPRPQVRPVVFLRHWHELVLEPEELRAVALASGSGGA